MAVYTVLEPPARSGRDPAPERYVFVRDGFSWGAFLFGPLWMLWRGLWLALLGYVLALAAFEALFRLTEASGWARGLVAFLLALLLGLEAASLRRFSLLLWRWRDRGIVVADDIESAERRFFHGWTPTRGGADGVVPPLHAGAGAQVASGRPAGIVGMFPQPGGTR